MKSGSKNLKVLLAFFLICFLLEGCAGIFTKRSSIKTPPPSVAAPPEGMEEDKELSREKGEKPSLETLYQEGKKAFREKKYDKAIGHYIEILASDPHYREIQRRLVKTYRAKAGQEERVAREQKKRRDFVLEEYTISFGDILDISVWQWPDLKAENTYVRPDGKISFPLVGDVEAIGRTITAVDEELTERLKEYVKSPEVSVAIRRFGGKKVIVLGEVSGPGVYAPTGNSTLLEVIALAGGFLKSAVTSNVVVIRGNRVRSEAIACDLRRALKEGDLSQNIATEPNDIIYVPRRFISGVTDLAGELGGSLGGVLTGTAVAKEFNWHRAGGR